MRCFVTVGSTQFNELVTCILNDKNLKILHKKGFKQLFIQFGSGELPLNLYKKDDVWEDRQEMKAADLIIGHAGAGTCLEALELNKPLIVVINNKLADNHQEELAEKLASNEHLLYTTPENLKETLNDANLFNLKVFPKADSKIFANFVDDYLGIETYKTL